MNNVSDIYMAEAGDVLRIPLNSASQHEIYAELIANEKLGTIETHPGVSDSYYVVKIVPVINATDFAKMLVLGEFKGEERINIAIPDGIKQETLRNAIYVLMRETHVYYTIRIVDGLVKAIRKANKKTGEGMHVKSLLTGLMKHGVVYDIQRPRNMKLPAFTQSIRREAQNRGLKVKMKMSPNGLVLALDDGLERVQDDNFKYRFEQWLDSLSYDVETSLIPPFDNPERRKYVQLCMHLSKHDCSMVSKTDFIIKHSSRIKKYKGQYRIIVKGKEIGVINKLDENIINLMLVPHGLTLQDLQS